MLRKKLRNQKEKFKRNLYEFILLKKSLQILNDFIKKYYILSIGFEEMYFGYRNQKRLKIVIVICILFWLATLCHLLFVLSNDLYSFLDGPYLPDHCRVLITLGIIILLFISVLKTDLLIGEIKFNSKPFEVFYYLMHDVKSKHKMNEKNYKRLAIISRIVQLIMMKYVLHFIFGLVVICNCIVAITSRRLIIAFILATFTPFYLMINLTATFVCCFLYIYFSYYKMLFDQYNSQFKILISDKSNVISKCKETKLIELINEHNLAAIEIHKMNMILNRTVAALFLTFSFVKIITLYLIMNIKHQIFNLMMQNIFGVFLTIGLGVSILISLQIKSAHKSYKFVYPIVCRGKMRLQFRFKVKFNKLIILI